MEGIAIDQVATDEFFDEAGYLLLNADVAKAVANSTFSSGLEHYQAYGKAEGRMQRNAHRLAAAKLKKRERIVGLLREDMPMMAGGSCLDFLTDDLSAAFNITSTDNISSNGYREEGFALIDKHKDGLVLDCGAGRRSIYYPNVVNFEIVDYDTTDVRGVGEKLPFKDNSFDAVFSLAVLEHVKDPFTCANEIIRVLKPGGDLLCCVPFLQPMHGYPNHYYNMTKQGIRNLFEPAIDIYDHQVRYYTLPIWTLTWFLNSWADGLQGEALDEFLNLKVSDLRARSETYLQRAFVTQLSEDKNFELACGTTILGVKKA